MKGGTFIVMAIISAALIGFASGLGAQNKAMETEAIERGCAAYDSKTGKWGWK